jgi:serine/threonine-protein kinase
MVTSDLGACEWFVWDLRRSGLIDRGQLDSIVSEFLKRNPRAEAPALAEFLVHQNTLTAFQAERVLNGKTQGLVLGPYVLLDAIGSGSMGQVYKATSKNDNALYAVKVLPRRSMWNVRLARRQVRSFSSFTHPAVVPFVDVGTAGGLHYLVWPLVEGTTLEGLVQQMGKLPANLTALYGVQIAQGLTVSHQNNLFHGLVKPSNVMIGSDNQARILDFGIGSLLVENEGESLVDTMSTANTLTSGLDCTSPECIMEPSNRTPAGDQYSLGCMLYYCLTGRVPFPEGSAVEKMMAHQTKEPMPIRELAPEVPEGLCVVIRRLMAKDPAGRFTGCDELVEALEPFLGDAAAAAANGHGISRGSGVSQSSGRRPGLGSRGTGSHPKVPGIAAKPPGSSETQSFGNRTSPNQSPSGSNPGTRTPSPMPPKSNGMGIPSRASFQLPPMADQVNMETSQVGRIQTPVDVPRPGPKLPSRSAAAPADQNARVPENAAQPKQAGEEAVGESAWAEEVDARPRNRNSFGQLGLVAATILLMVAVYLGATLLMKH